MDFVKIDYPNNKLETQYKIKKETSDAFRICWLDKNNLKPGMRVKLKGEDDWYVILERYNTMKAEILDMNRNPNWFSVEESEGSKIIF